MSRKKSKTDFKPDYFSSCAETGHDSFAMVYDSLLKSPQYSGLTGSAKLMYLYCRNQLASQAGRQVIYNHAKDSGTTYDQYCFVFPAKHMELYGIKRSNGTRALRELQDAGFITKIEQNAHRHKINIYRFSAEWKNR